MKYENLPDYPLLLDLELTNLCNMRCLFCGTLAQTRDKGYMTEDVFNRILEEATLNKIHLRFIRWGEPLLHKDIIKWLKLAVGKGLYTHITTNGSLLNKEISSQLVDIELDSIKISFQGANEEGYSVMRNNKMYSKVVANLKMLHKIRGERKKPFMEISSSMTDETDEEIDAFRSMMGKYTDKVVIGKTNMNRYEELNMELKGEELKRFRKLVKIQTVRKLHKECPEVFDKLSVNFDGTVSACCGDYNNLMIVGDIKKQTLGDIWKSEKMKMYRRMLANKEHRKLPLCKTCYVTRSYQRIIENEGSQ